MSRTLIVDLKEFGEFWSDDPDPWTKLLINYTINPKFGYYNHADYVIYCIDTYESKRRHWGHVLRVLQANAASFTDATYIAEYTIWLVNLYMESDDALSKATGVPVNPVEGTQHAPTTTQ
jgi:hypothetical protein